MSAWNLASHPANVPASTEIVRHLRRRRLIGRVTHHPSTAQKAEQRHRADVLPDGKRITLRGNRRAIGAVYKTSSERRATSCSHARFLRNAIVKEAATPSSFGEERID